MINISIDLETYSDVDLPKCGVYKYAESPQFEILLFAYSVDGGEVQAVDLAGGEKIPPEILSAITDNSVTKWAFNANFERICLSKYLGLSNGEYLDPTSWKCTMTWAAYLGLPLSLEGAGAVLGLEQQKLKEGKDLIKYFCVPCLPTKANGGRTRNLPTHAPEKWRLFKSYNKRDVEVEMSIQSRLSKFPVPEFVWEEYHLDQRINDRGICLDMELVRNAIAFDERSRKTLTTAMQDLTNLENPNSVTQMKQWLSENGLETNTLGKKAVAELIKSAPAELQQVLILRQQLAKSSVKKYTAMENAVCNDNRARGMFKFYGANRTGRWAGKNVQLQNLPQNHIPDLEQARELVKCGDYTALEMLYEDIPDTLSQLIRTAFVPQNNHKFIVADFSAIEARVLSWLSGEKWRSEVFRTGGDIYCASASQMFGVPLDRIVKGNPEYALRQKGKVATLALGYQGGSSALIAMGALKNGLTEEELPDIVSRWRQANRAIVRCWKAVEQAAIQAVETGRSCATHGLVFAREADIDSGLDFLTIRLPSGRKLYYAQPHFGVNQWGGKQLRYYGMNQMTKKWSVIETYGGHMTENIVQAIARDCLAVNIERLENAGFPIVFHIHDEVVIEVPEDRADLDEVTRIMGQPVEWAPGLPLAADGWVGDYFTKD